MNPLWRRVFTPALVVLFVLSGLALVTAAQPQQSYSKIYLSPFYRATLTGGTNASYNVVVAPPDGVSSVVNAMLSFNVQVNGQTQTFSAWVNGQSCRNPTYSIATAFSTTGQLQAYFDCANIITKAGNYTVTLLSGVNTGAVSGWLDLTYMNNPPGNVVLHGTEYVPGDTAKMFLQFLDANNNAVNNSECFLTLWYPNDTMILNNSLMSHLNNLEEGIFYKNYNVPNVTGVYPASAKCYRPLTFYNIILQAVVSDGFESGGWTGGIGWSTCPVGSINCTNGWDVEDTGPLATIVTNASAGCQSGSYCAKFTGSYGFMERGVSFPDGIHEINFTYWFKFTGFQTNEHFQFFIFDGNWHLIDTIGSDVTGGSYTNGVWYRKTYILNESLYEIAGPTLFGWYTSGMPSTSDSVFIDNITIDEIYPNISIGNETEYQILRGSGEIHVSNFYNNLNASLSNLSVSLTNLTLETIWNYASRNLTYYPPGNNLSAADIWSYDPRNLTYYPSGSNLSAADVWAYANRNLTYYADVVNYTRIPVDVWAAAVRTLTYYQDVMNYTRIPDDVWMAASRNLTYYQDVTNYTLIPASVWSYITRTLTLYQDVTNYSAAADAVWNASNRTLTYYPPQVDLTNYSQIAVYVWNEANRTLTYYPPGNNLSAAEIWGYTDRNLTYYPAQVDLTNYTQIQFLVWNASTRELTYYPAGNNLTAADVWAYGVRNLTFFPEQVDLTNYTRVQFVVWNATTRELTYYPPTNNLSALDVWTYIDRNLTYYPPENNLTASDVWNYSGNVTPSLLAQFAEFVWTYVGRYVHGVLI
jgi:hypothetical protein